MNYMHLYNLNAYRYRKCNLFFTFLTLEGWRNIFYTSIKVRTRIFELNFTTITLVKKDIKMHLSILKQNFSKISGSILPKHSYSPLKGLRLFILGLSNF